MRRAVRSIAAAAAWNYTAIALSFGVAFVLTHAMGPEAYGRLAVLLMAGQILLFIGTHWTFTPLVHFSALEHAASGTVGQTLAARMTLIAPLILMIAALFVIFRAELSVYLDVPGSGIVAVFAYFIATAALNTGGALLQGTHRVSAFALSVAIERALALAGVILLVTLGDARDAVTVLLVLTASAAGSAAWTFVGLGRGALRSRRPSTAALAELSRYSVPLLASTWFGFFGSQWIDLLFIRRSLPLDDAGLYALAYQLGGVAQQLTVVVSAYMLPRYSVLIAGGRWSEVGDILRRAVPYWLLGVSVAICAALVLIPPTVAALFGPTYERTTSPLLLLLVATMSLAIFNSVNPILIASGRTWAVSIGVLASVGTNVALDAALVPIFGIVGAAMSTLAAYSVSALATLFIARAALGLRVISYPLFLLPVGSAYLILKAVEGVGGIVLTVIVTLVWSVILVRVFSLFIRPDLGRLSGVRRTALH